MPKRMSAPVFKATQELQEANDQGDFMPVTSQTCSTTGCANQAAFTTRTKPAWCESCLNAILGELGMDPVTAFPGKAERWRTRCRVCAAECDYKLEYLLELRTRAEPPCRRCFWIQWTVEGALKYGRIPAPINKEQVAEHLESREYEAVEALVDLPDSGWPVIARCLRCGVQGAHRIGDLSCSCRSNAAPRTTGAGRTRGTKALFADSQNPALAWWDHELNDPSLLATLTAQARTQCRWKGPACGHTFTAAVYTMTGMLTCPECGEERTAQHRAEREQLKTTPVADIPELLAAWNEPTDPGTVMVYSYQARRFRCESGHQPRVIPNTYLEQGCPFCRAAGTASVPRPMLADALPEIAGQWHPTLNGKWTPQTVGPDSTRLAHWLTDCCGFTWSASVRARNGGERLRCPRCMTILDSLGWSDPGLAAEWDPANPLTPWHVRPHGKTPFIPRWICSVDPSHQWKTTLTSRSNGSECPECRQSSKSRVELQHMDAAETLFESVKSGAVVREPSFSTRKQWSVDILVEHRGTKVVVEYDGAYWHRPEAKMEVDRRKSRDLLAAGYRVVRLREDDLPKLEIDSPHYLELRVHSAAPRPDETLSRIKEWLASST